MTHHPEIEQALMKDRSSFVMAAAGDSPAVPRSLARLGCHVVVVDETTIDGNRAMLVRPDGYVAAMVRDDDDMNRFDQLMEEYT